MAGQGRARQGKEYNFVLPFSSTVFGREHGVAWQGKARRGAARQGKARQGKEYKKHLAAIERIKG